MDEQQRDWMMDEMDFLQQVEASKVAYLNN